MVHAPAWEVYKKWAFIWLLALQETLPMMNCLLWKTVTVLSLVWAVGGELVKLYSCAYSTRSFNNLFQLKLCCFYILCILYDWLCAWFFLLGNSIRQYLARSDRLRMSYYYNTIIVVLIVVLVFSYNYSSQYAMACLKAKCMYTYT